MHRTWILGLAAIFASMLFASAARVDEDDAVKTTKKTVDAVVAILRNEDLGYADKRKKVDGVIRERVDQVILARLVLARNWSKLDDAQQKEFVTLFTDHLVLTYWDSIEGTKIAGIEVTGDREENRGDWTVKTKVDLGKGKDPVLIDYRLRRQKLEGDEKGPWLIIDIKVEGVSLISNFRAQLAEVFSNGGAKHLIDAIKKKNKKLNERLEKEHADD